MTKNDLNKIKSIRQRIKEEQDRLLKLNDWIKRITQEIDGLSHEQSYQRSSLEDLTVQIVDCERNIAKLKLICAESRAELVKQLDDLISDNDQKTVLIERYVFGEYFKRIAEKLHMSKNNVYILHRQGLRNLCK